MRLRTVRLLAGREWRAALSARWFWVYIGATVVLSVGLMWLAAGMMPSGLPAAAAGGRLMVTTVNLLALLVPLMGLSAGSQSLARERDRRTLAYLLAQPVTRTEVLLGKLLGNALALGAALAAATVVLLAVVWWFYLPLPATVLVAAAGLAWLLAMASLTLGVAIAARAPGLVAAQGATLAAWLVLVLVGDLGLMGSVLLRQVSLPVQLALGLLNPVHQFRVAAVALFHPSLETLGPAGFYLRERLGDGLIPALVLALAAWTAGMALLAIERFRNSRAVS